MNLSAFFAQHRNAVLAGGAGVVVVGATVVRKRNAASSSTSATAGYPPTYDTTGTDSALQFDSAMQSQEDYINGQVDALSSILAGVQKPVTPKAPRPKPKKTKPKKKPTVPPHPPTKRVPTPTPAPHRPRRVPRKKK